MEAGSITSAKLRPIAHGSLKDYRVGHLPQLAVALEHDVPDVPEDPVPFAAKLSHARHPQQAPVFSVRVERVHDLLYGFDLDQFAGPEIQSLTFNGRRFVLPHGRAFTLAHSDKGPPERSAQAHVFDVPY